jgi:hypothetical protein
VNIADENGRTLLQRCYDQGNRVRPQVIDLLRQHGAVARAGKTDEGRVADSTPAPAAATIPAR